MSQYIRISATVPRVPTTVAVLNLKGGTGKTTTAAHAAQALHEAGARVLAVDADPQGSLVRWAEAADFPFATVAKPSAKLHRELPGIVGEQWNVVVIDTPPTNDGKAIVTAAARAASHVLVPLTPSTIEHDRLTDVQELLDEVAVLHDMAVAVVLVKVKRSAASGEVYREALERGGWRVLKPIVPDWESFRQAWGLPLQRRHVEAYADVVAELLEEAPG